MLNTKTRIEFLLLFLLLSNAAFGQQYRDLLKEIPATPEMFVRAMQMTNPTAAQFDTVWATTQNYITLARKDTIQQLVEHAIAITQNHQIKPLYGKALFLKGKIQLEDRSNPLLGVELFAKAIQILEKENVLVSPCGT